MNNNKRIAKNTLFLYFRMIVLMVIGLYTSRVTLNVLGADDYGIYNVVGGIVSFFLFFNNALTAGVQRFLNFYIGEDDEESVKKIFAQSYFIFIVLAFIILLLSETVGLLLLEKYMVIPAERMDAARIVFQISVFSTAFMVLRIPFQAVIIAYEHMTFFAYISMVEGVLKLIGVVMLLYIDIDKLIVYAVFIGVISIVLYVVYFVYCKYKFTIINFKVYKDKHLMKEIMTFSSWNVVGTAASVTYTQGVNVLINRFFGVAANAAIGIANQVNQTIYQFLSNLQIAFNPQIVKSYAQGDREYLDTFVIRVSKISFYLLYFIILPFLVNMDFVLELWLVNVPDMTDSFVLLLCTYTLIDAVSGPMWMLVDAEGDIKKYQIVSTCFSLSAIVLAFISYYAGMPAYTGQFINTLVNFTFMLWRIYYLKKKIDFPWKRYCKSVYIPIVLIITLSVFPIIFVRNAVSNPIGGFFASCITSCVVLGGLYCTIGLTKGEKASVLQMIRKKVFKRERGN